MSTAHDGHHLTQAERDAAELTRVSGHRQELQRTFSPLSMIGFAFAILNSWTALAASLSIAVSIIMKVSGHADANIVAAVWWSRGRHLGSRPRCDLQSKSCCLPGGNLQCVSDIRWSVSLDCLPEYGKV